MGALEKLNLFFWAWANFANNGPSRRWRSSVVNGLAMYWSTFTCPSASSILPIVLSVVIITMGV